jgi:hypothetical protein
MAILMHGRIRSQETLKDMVPIIDQALASGHRSTIDTSRSRGIRNSDGPADTLDKVLNSHVCFA